MISYTILDDKRRFFMDFENFCNLNENSDCAKNVTEVKQKLDDSEQKKLGDLMEKYKNKSSDELLQELMSVAKKEKQKGNLNEKRLNEIYSTLSPMLNENEKEKLKNLIDIIG